MEAIPILISFLFKVFLVVVGFRLVYSSYKEKSLFLRILGFVLFVVPALTLVFQMYGNKILPIPKQEEFVGKYKVSRCLLGVAKDRYEKCVLELKQDSTFVITNGEFISSFCNEGLYDIDFEFEGNEIGFSCNGGWEMSSIRRALLGYRVILVRDYDRNKGLLEFKKTE